VCEEIADETVGVFLFHSHRCIRLGTENARCQCVGKSRNVGFIGGCQLDESGEMGH